jgi:diaminohydroxyphosphoribosylaminopyrimidine deaminase/5-amino-6-(5-phosphoribosylamino)uracil reductase
VALDCSPEPWLTLALDLAARAVGASEPNPRVGCVLVDARMQLLGQGHTQPAGQAHAEVMALRDAAASGADPKGATAFVTLEPCSHHGRTPPCCDALVAAGVARVVVALQDPNPLVAGQGMARLRAAGVEVLLLPVEHPVARASKDLNIGFFSRMQRGRPWLRMKIASSLDGKTALDNGQSQWITGEAARADGHQWRKRAGAVLTGIGTVLEDDPLLDVRLAPTVRQPALVLVDSRLETPLGARLFSVAGRALLVYAATQDVDKTRALEARGARIVQMPGPSVEGRSKVDLGAMLRDLAQQHQINELHVEAGHKLNGSLLREGLVDELLVYLAPRLLGQGRDMASLGPLSQLSESTNFEFTSITPLGADLRLLARRA